MLNISARRRGARLCTSSAQLRDDAIGKGLGVTHGHEDSGWTDPEFTHPQYLARAARAICGNDGQSACHCLDERIRKSLPRRGQREQIPLRHV